MNEFLKEYYTLITYSVEFLALVVGLIYFKKYKNTPARFIIYFLCFAFFVDFLGNYPNLLKKNDLFHLIENTLVEKNYWWFTIFWWVGLSSFMFYINYKIVQTSKYKSILLYAFYLYLLQVVLTITFRFEYIFRPDERAIKIASLWIVLLSIIIYFFETLTSDKIIRFYKSIYFYFNSIIFVWILIMIPMDFFEAYNNVEDWSYVLFKRKIYLLLNIYLYLSMVFVLIFCKPENKVFAR
ncbi:MAG: hypothetical protein CMC76_03910 [Flavobacteriaceae bacterium]|nr:hypothetical protein [Flavobacteriaceae bacterium]|tara:strand:- start:1382 stop:2098 length:717 start_codon:yes stop_codon:yes gene_type:complete